MGAVDPEMIILGWRNGGEQLYTTSFMLMLGGQNNFIASKNTLVNSL